MSAEDITQTDLLELLTEFSKQLDTIEQQVSKQQLQLDLVLENWTDWIT